MDDDTRRKRKPIVKLLDAANLDLDAATRLLADPPVSLFLRMNVVGSGPGSTPPG